MPLDDSVWCPCGTYADECDKCSLREFADKWAKGLISQDDFALRA